MHGISGEPFTSGYSTMQTKSTPDIHPQDTASSQRAVSTSAAEFPNLVESARYALLQRLAPALQHHLVGQLQPMDMIVLMMERRLQAASPDLAGLRQDCALLGNVSRTAVRSLLDMMSWIDPRPESALKVDAGVKDCLKLLVTEFRFNGFVIVSEVPDMQEKVASRAFRSLLCATLVALGDAGKAPASIVIRAQALAQQVELSITLHPTEGTAKNGPSSHYRSLIWRDVEILALAESVALAYGEKGAQLVFPQSATDENAGFSDGSGI
ncbi:MAG: hypothetical protein JWR74_1350 [Polaromonas sp.]|jgi:hypothetical protein|nr:hypothetical protein [Polaromonas sp.]